MTDRERLIELLTGYSIDTPPDVEYVADHLIANGVTVQRWIRVTEEEIPDMECIAVGYQNEMLVGWLIPDAYSDTGYSAESDSEILRNVTHWMPLPEPPGGERKVNDDV